MRWYQIPALLVSLALYGVGLLLILGYSVPAGSNTVRGFGWDGLVSTWWGRAMAAAFMIFLATLLVVPMFRSRNSKRSNK
jgi:membrane protein implicated in regulation of membrane protease activity